MTSIFIHSDGSVEETSDREFFRRVFGKELPSDAEIAERAARRARIELLVLIERTEYARANREREAIRRDASVNGTGDYEDYLRRVNEPFARAAERVKARMAEFDAKRNQPKDKAAKPRKAA